MPRSGWIHRPTRAATASLVRDQIARHGKQIRGNNGEILYRRYRRRQTQTVNNPPAILEQAFSAHRAGQFEQAIALYQQVLAHDATQIWAHNGIGHAYFSLGRYPEARAGFEAAIRIDPSFAEAFHGLGLLEKSWANYDEALEHFRHAQRLRPDYVDAIAGEASLLEAVGKKKEAYDLLASLVEKGIVNTNLAVAYANVARHDGETERALAALRRALSVPNLARADQVYLHFELGKHLDAAGDYTAAFEHFRQGNLLKGAVFDSVRHAGIVNEIIRTFDRKGFPDYARAAQTSDLPVFIVGMPRSGTSLVESILAAHPAVHGAGELDFFGLFSRSLPPSLVSGKTLLQLMRAVDGATLDRVATEYLNLLRRLGGDAVVRVTDKMPYNFFWLGLLELLFPDARVIHCLRDPRDTCLSIYFHDFTGQHHYAYDLRNIGLYYREYRRLMAHWREVGSLPLLEVQYESLVKSPDAQTRRIVEFCGLSWNNACLKFHTSNRVTKTASYDQVRRPLYASAVGRWRHYEAYLSPLIEELDQEL
jgi:tetratricopeptide (TPR) repeat protein